MEPIWFDTSCFFKIRRPISVSIIDGFANLHSKHHWIRDHINEDKVDPVLEKQIQKQNTHYFEMYDKLKALKEDDYVAILEAKNQYVPGNLAEVRNACDLCRLSHDTIDFSAQIKTSNS